MNQAKRGGEQGLNGEWYEGGQFLPGSEDTIKGAVKIRKGTKAQIAPYVWAPSPADDMLSIYDRIAHECRDNRRECEFVKGQGFIGLKLTVSPTEMSVDKTHYNKEGGWVETLVPREPARLAWLTALAEKFNAGERWFPLADDPYHYKNQVKK